MSVLPSEAFSLCNITFEPLNNMKLLFNTETIVLSGHLKLFKKEHVSVKTGRL